VATTILRRFRLDRGGPALALDSGWRNLIVLAVALNMATSVGFFDNVEAQTFPFKQHWQELVRFFDQGGQWSLPAH
jgi:hypothetical protein